MKKSKGLNNSKWMWVILPMSLALIGVATASIKRSPASVTNEMNSATAATAVNEVDLEKKIAAQREVESKQAFVEAYKVFMHPRCMNCHPAGDIPLQGDDSHLHAQGVKRGKDGKGLYALKCKNCHQDTHIAGLNMPPGSPGWHLPPANLKMVFEGKSPRQLAIHFKDPKFTGFKTLDKMIEHVEKEPLVLNSWTYGTPPPLSHAEFVEKVKEWIEKGAAVPDK